MQWKTLCFAVPVMSLLAGNVSAFNNIHFKGGYAFRLVGPSSYVRSNLPRTVATGVLIADGNGHVSGHGKFRSAGVTCDGNIKGSYNINIDGTGILTSVFSSSTPGCFTNVLDIAMVLFNNGEGFEVATFENDYLSGTFTRQNKTKFTLNDLNGTYALRLVGPSSVAKASQPLTVGVGMLYADGRGKIKGNGMLRSNGVSCRGTFAGNYNVSSDGSGVITSNFQTNTPGCFSTVVDLSVALFQKGNGAEVANFENDYMAGSIHRQVLQ